MACPYSAPRAASQTKAASVTIRSGSAYPSVTISAPRGCSASARVIVSSVCRSTRSRVPAARANAIVSGRHNASSKR